MFVSCTYASTQPGKFAAGSARDLTPASKTEDESQEDRHWVALGAFDPCGKFLATSCDGKSISLWDVATWERKKVWSGKRRFSALKFTPCGRHVLVSDKAGDSYRYVVDQDTEGGELVLGHISVILDLALSPCSKYLLTADRDEKIRVSHYPNAYNIAQFCLGHAAFVSCIAIPPRLPHLVLSGSGRWNDSFVELLAWQAAAYSSC